MHEAPPCRKLSAQRSLDRVRALSSKTAKRRPNLLGATFSISADICGDAPARSIERSHRTRQILLQSIFQAYFAHVKSHVTPLMAQSNSRPARKRIIAAITSSRSDYAHLRWLLHDLSVHPDVDLRVIALGP